MFVGRGVRVMAALGGIVLMLLILLTCLSVTGRLLNTMLHGWIGQVAPAFSAWALELGVGPLNGDFELVEAGIAFTVFAFLPLCQYASGHAVVDIFTARLPARAGRLLIMIIECVFAAVLILIAIQLFDGMMSKRRFGETTFLLQFPVWWAYVAALFPACIAALTGLYMAGLRVRECRAGHSLTGPSPESLHE